MHLQIKFWLRAYRYPLMAAGIILAAVAARVALVALGWPGTDSDDATMGLMAKHILTKGEHPIFFWGQAYMGTIEAYLGALMFAFLGVSEFALKCGLIVLYAAFMVVMYFLLSRLFSQKWALMGLLFLAGSTDDMLYHQLEAYGGYLETIFFGALLTLLATWIAYQSQGILLFAAWGIAAGLAIYSDPLVLPFVGLSGLLIVLVQWRAVRGWLGAVALLGLLVGVSPWLVYIVTEPSLNAAQSFLKPAFHTTTAHAPSGPGLGERIADQALGTVFISIPNNTGVNALCPLTANDAWPLAHWTTPRVAGCMVLRGAWGTSIIALLIAALALEGGTFWTLWRRGSGSWLATDRTRAVLAGGRLVAVGAPVATVLLFALSSSAGTSPWIYSRYLISLAIALPVAVAVLWQHMPRPALPLWHPVQWRRIGIVMLSGFLALALALGVAGTFTEAHAQQAKTQQEMALVNWLETNNHTRFYSNFWTCMRVIFQSNERLVCSIVTDQLAIAPNRYAPYDATVAAAHPTLYLFPVDTVMAHDFPAYAAQQGWHLTTTMLFEGQYVAYEVQLAGG